MYFLEKAKGVAMQSTMITPSTQSIASTSFLSNTETKTDIKNVRPIKIEAKVQNDNKQQEQKNIENLKNISLEFNEISDELNLDIKFAYNEKIDTVYLNVTDKNTGKIIRKLPSEDAMKIKESMKDLVGVLFDEKG